MRIEYLTIFILVLLVVIIILACESIINDKYNSSIGFVDLIDYPGEKISFYSSLLFCNNNIDIEVPL